MSELNTFHHPSRIKIIQQRISIVTWSITLLLSLRGLFAFYGMKDKGFVEQIIITVTEPLVQLFNFDLIAAIGIPGISVLFAAVSFLLISNIAQVGLWVAAQRRVRAQNYVSRHAAHYKLD